MRRVKGKLLRLQFTLLLFLTRCKFLGWVLHGRGRNYDFFFLVFYKKTLLALDSTPSLHRSLPV